MSNLSLVHIGIALVVFVSFIIYRFLSDNNKLFARCLTYSALLGIAISPLRGYFSFIACMAVGYVLFFLLTYVLIIKLSSKANTEKITLSILAGFLILNIPRFYDFKGSLISLPDECFHFLGIVVGYLFFKIKTFTRWIILVTASVLCLFVYIKGYEMWGNKLFYGTFSGKIEMEEAPENLAFADFTNSPVSINRLKGKVVVLDFWNSKCGVCYRKFPELQKTFNKYKQNTRVSFYSVNSFIKGIDKDGDAFRIIKEKGYSFPVLVCKDQTLLRELRVTVFPTVLILNKDGEFVFRGDIEDADKKIEELLKDNQ
ncbi:MAG: TlpA disulfide reductase family protein [Paludibacter sp.]